MKEVECSIEVSIDALESIFEVQKLKNEFRFSGHTHRKGCSRNGKSVETVCHQPYVSQSAAEVFSMHSIWIQIPS